MSYYKHVLQPDETVKVIGRLHWTLFLPAIQVALVAVALLAVASRLSRGPSDWHFARIPAGVAGVLALGMFMVRLIQRHTTEIVVTDRRVIFKRGLFSRHTVEMNVSKIETVDVEQNFWARILGHGTLMIHGTGSGFEPLRGVSDPLTIRNAIVAG